MKRSHSKHFSFETMWLAKVFSFCSLTSVNLGNYKFVWEKWEKNNKELFIKNIKSLKCEL